MERLQSILSQVGVIVEREKTMQAEKWKRGENFNVFQVLDLQTNETRLHSALIAELLNPNGSHGLGDTFLKAFIGMMPLDFDEFNTKSAEVFVEFYIGEISKDGSEGGRIDILIKDNRGKAIIIENKIYAGDQRSQLLRYDTFAIKTYGEAYRLLYLTLEGNEPSEFSTKGEKRKVEDYRCISYRHNIIPWMEECVQKAACFPLVRETIRQYMTTLKSILNIMDENNTNEIIEILTKEENLASVLDVMDNAEAVKCYIRANSDERIIALENNTNKIIEILTKEENLASALAVMDNAEAVKCHIRANFVGRIIALAKEYGFSLSKVYNDTTGFIEQHENYAGLWFEDRAVSKSWSIHFDYETERWGVWYAIRQTAWPEPDVVVDYQSLKPLWESAKQSNACPYGMKYFPGEFRDWKKPSTLKDMTAKDSHLFQFIKTEIFDRIKERGFKNLVEPLPE